MTLPIALIEARGLDGEQVSASRTLLWPQQPQSKPTTAATTKPTTAPTTPGSSTSGTSGSQTSTTAVGCNNGLVNFDTAFGVICVTPALGKLTLS